MKTLKRLQKNNFHFPTSHFLKAEKYYQITKDHLVTQQLRKEETIYETILDTSSLFKLYNQEVDSDIIESVFTNYKVTDIFLSELSKIEFASTVWKKVRIQDITEMQAKAITEAFEKDFSKYTFVQIDNIIIEKAKDLITKYGKQGLRALDSIQLSTAVMLGGSSRLICKFRQIIKLIFKTGGNACLKVLR